MVAYNVLNLCLECPQGSLFNRSFKSTCFFHRARKSKKQYSTTEYLDNKLILSVSDISIQEKKILCNRTVFRNSFIHNNRKKVKINLLSPCKIPINKTINLSLENHTIDTTINSLKQQRNKFLTVFNTNPLVSSTKPEKVLVQTGVGTDKIPTKFMRASFSVLNLSAIGNMKTEYDHKFFYRRSYNTLQLFNLRLLKRKSTVVKKNKSIMEFPKIEKGDKKYKRCNGHTNKLLKYINLKLDCEVPKKNTTKDRIPFKKQYTPIRLKRRRTALCKVRLFQRLNANQVNDIIYLH